MTENGLAKALADFQGKGYAIPRLRTVTVQTKAGGSYTFDYAPHELIVAAIRQPLAEAGLAVSQILSMTPEGAPALRTVLLHTSGERLEDTFPLPLREGMSAQEIGSAITYIRRYALSAILGLATEDDDDGNRASGNTVNERRDRAKDGPPAPESATPPAPPAPREGDLIGVAQAAKPPHDFELRQTPDGPAIGFALKEGREQVRVIAYGTLATEIGAFREAVEGKRVQCFGTMSQESWTVGAGTKAEKSIPYTRLTCSRLTADGLALPMPDVPTLPLGLVPEVEAELDAVLP